MLTWLIDHRGSLTAVGHQGNRSTCLAWAMTAAHEFLTQDERLSVEFLHWNSGQYSGGRGTVLAASSSIEAEGQPPVSQWEYLSECDEYSATYVPPHSVVGPFRKAPVRTGALDVEMIISHLQSRRLPVIGLRITDSFLSAKGGLVGRDGVGQGGHATVAVGVAQLEGNDPIGFVQPGDRLVCLRNSWGVDWGIGGHCLISEAALTECGLGIFALISVQPYVAS